MDLFISALLPFAQRSRVKNLCLTYAALLTLVFGTVFISTFSLGNWQVPIALGFAIAKALLVAWIFMELNSKKALLRLAACAGLFWIMTLYFFGALDLLFRADLPS
jgi:cytochrome c oxidase subunit 4